MHGGGERPERPGRLGSQPQDILAEPARAGEPAAEGGHRPHRGGGHLDHRGGDLPRRHERVQHRDVGGIPRLAERSSLDSSRPTTGSASGTGTRIALSGMPGRSAAGTSPGSHLSFRERTVVPLRTLGRCSRGRELRLPGSGPGHPPDDASGRMARGISATSSTTSRKYASSSASLHRRRDRRWLDVPGVADLVRVRNERSRRQHRGDRPTGWTRLHPDNRSRSAAANSGR